MLRPGLKIIFILETSFSLFKDSYSAVQRHGCKEQCSSVYDPVCGRLVALGNPRTDVIKRFHNQCQLRKIQCIFTSYLPAYRLNETVASECGLSGRRVHDFTIVGAHQACNHTCPTFCLDTYKPVCAQIWKSDASSFLETQYEYKPMINHCHADLFSCVLRVNITLQPFLNKCYHNPQLINYMYSVAALRTMKFFNKSMPRKPRFRRSALNWIEKKDLTDLLKMAV